MERAESFGIYIDESAREGRIIVFREVSGYILEFCV